MNIEPGTRVRLTNNKLPELGTYISFLADKYHLIHWDFAQPTWNDLHTEDEFEVIDE